ncbi:hypothetical protein AX27061_0930 [Achromobacter xylosoxidans NBRC 15126 = ATCC 27061]|nr:hypothetical protein AX27061_0930 [Achromobacter xylosoxidans NBRC 15126 = ATCC 27061]CCH05204.1 hypothetical protein NH44784_012271 [Achromobacter xylosoxidans NH44784-1996]
MSGGGTIAFNHVCPRAVCAVSVTSRPWPAYAREICRSGGGKRPSARSGHSIKTTASSRSKSRNPASNHSRESLNL